MKFAAFICFLFMNTALIANKANAFDTKHKNNGHTVAVAVEGWFFRAVSGYPAAISFEPVVLFKNGDSYDVGDEPLETLDIASSKVKRPAAWGKWTKSGQKFLLTNNKGKTYDYKLGAGNWFPAYPFLTTVKLKRAYEKTSGGDYGNGTQALSISKINFVDATHFTMGANSGISTSNASAWKKSANGGTYRIYNHTIEFTFADGKVVKKTFALGAEGSPAHATNTLIFIGGDAYTDTE